jgi:processive 1,2-diacylglycerol beta-glucosyltransferase
LIDSAAGSTVALLRAEELGDLQKRYGSPDGGLVLRRGQALVSLRWEERRLLRAMLGGMTRCPSTSRGSRHPFASFPGDRRDATHME